MNLKEYQEFKTRIEEFRRKEDRARGALEQMFKQLKEEYECESLQEAEKELKKLLKKQEQTDLEIDKEMKAFEEKWGKLLGD